MRFKKAIIAALGVSMVAAPVLAQSAAPLSVAASARAGAAFQGSSLIEEDDLLLPAAVLIAILAAAILLTGNSDGPSSP